MSHNQTLLKQIPGVTAQSNQKIFLELKKIPELDKVRLFGSRALGTFKSGSDIDLCLYGANLQLRNMTKLRSRLDQLNIPYEVDVCQWDSLESEAFKAHISTYSQDLDLS